MDLILTILLAITLLLFWLPVSKKVIYVATGLAAAYGAYAGILEPFALLSLLILFIASTLYFTNKHHLFLGISLAILCWVLSKNWIPGFLYWKAASNVKLAPDSIPFSIFFTYDKAFVGIALLLTMGQLKFFRIFKDLKKNWPIFLLCLLTLEMSALGFSYIHFDPKLSSITPLWLFHNLFFICIPEEAFFRGFIQKELNEKPLLALAASSLLFGVFHAHWGPVMVIYSTIAGLFYGWVWMKTERLEASIALHLLVNATHFFLFSYPRVSYT